MNSEDFLSGFTHYSTNIITAFTLILSALAVWIGLKAWKVNKEQLRTAQESRDLQEQQYQFGRNFTKGKLITDGSLKLHFLEVDFIGPFSDEYRIFEDLMPRSAINALLTVENHSISDAIVQDLIVVPKFWPGKSRQSWVITNSLARAILKTNPVEGEMVISLKDREIKVILGSTARGWDDLLLPWRGYFRRDGDTLKHAWRAIMYTETGEQFSFDESIIIPHDGVKRVWKLEFSLEPELYRDFLLQYNAFFSGIKIIIVTDLGNIKADFEYDDIRAFAEILL